MPITQERIVTLARLCEECLATIKMVQNEAMTGATRSETSASIILQIIGNNTRLLEAAIVSSHELAVYSPRRIRENNLATERQRRKRAGQQNEDFKVNSISHTVSGKLTPSQQQYFKDVGIKVIKPDEYDHIYEEHHAPPAALPHPQAHQFHDNLHDVPSNEAELFAEPDDTEAEQ